MGTWVSSQLKKSQERERRLLQVLDKELNQFFPKPRKREERKCRGEWRVERGDLAGSRGGEAAFEH